MNIFDIILVQPFFNVLVVIYHGLYAIHVPFALAFSMVLLTILIRLLLLPVMQQSLKQQKKMQDIMPEINKLKEKYKNDQKRLQMEQMALFQSRGVNPASGCVPLLLQFPILIALYNVLLKVVHFKTPAEINHWIYTDSLKLNHLWDTSFFGLSLGLAPKDMLSHVGPAIILVAFITGALQLIQSKMMMPTKEAAAANKPQKKNDEPDFSTIFQSQTLYMLPIFIGYFAFTLPLGLSLYWNTLTIFGIIQQYTISGWGGLKDWMPGQKPSSVSKYK